MSDCGPSRDFKEIYFRARKVINDTTKMDNSFRSDPVGKNTLLQTAFSAILPTGEENSRLGVISDSGISNWRN